MVPAPPEFLRLAQAFQLECPKDAQSEQEWIAAVLRHLNPNSRRVVKTYLTDLLSKNPDEKELQKLWDSTHSGYYIVGKHGNDGVRSVLTMIRDQIDSM